MNKKILMVLICVFILLTAITVGIVFNRSKSIFKTEVSPEKDVKNDNYNIAKCEYDNQELMLEIPKNWKFEIVGNEVKTDGLVAEANFGIRFYKDENNKEKNAVLYSQKDKFGVCGTGLKTEKLVTNEGQEAEVGYFDQKEDWDYVAFRNDDVVLIAYNNGLEGKDAKEALKILETMRFVYDVNFSMKIKEGSLTRTTATIVIEDKNKSDSFGTGEPYAIEKKEEGKWKKLPLKDDIAWIEIWYDPREDGTLIQNLNWKNIYGELPNGEYRVVKSISNNSKNMNIYAEFKLDGKMRVAYRYDYSLPEMSFEVEIADKELIELINYNIFERQLENCHYIDLAIMGNYRVTLNNNVSFYFDQHGYSEEKYDKNGYVMINKDSKTFLTKIDPEILKRVVAIVDIELTERSKIFNTSLITIKNKEERAVTIDRPTAVKCLLDNCKYTYIKEINYEPNLVKPDYEIDFNNGIKILKYEKHDNGYFLKDGILAEIYGLDSMDDFLNIAINYMEERIKMFDCNEITIVSPEKEVTIKDKYQIEKVLTPIIFSTMTSPDWLKDYDIKEEYDKGIKVKMNNGYEYLISGVKTIGNRYILDKDGKLLHLCFGIIGDKNIKEALN